MNCNAYDSGFVTTGANTPAAGIAAGLIHASTDTADAGDNDADDGATTVGDEPENVAALSASLANKPAEPSVTPPLYTPGFAPTASIADVPDVSPNRQ